MIEITGRIGPVMPRLSAGNARWEDRAVRPRTKFIPRAFAALVVALVLAAPAPAAADEGGVSHPNNNVYVARDSSTALAVVQSCQDAWPRLPDVAERLGVAPVMGKGSTASDRPQTYRLVLSMCDGRAYAIDELADKLLDRLDGVTK